ncbi:MAG: lipoprotein signal peptidase [Cyclobacteriaceae bacterium]|nr:lipoprotein signal peptidase [Cyclobacteriaceae bacterium]
MKYLKFYLLAIAIILIDQVVKMLVHYNMDMGLAGQIPVFGEWFKLHYTLNPGMAFGLQIGLDNGKLILTIFRLFAMVGIGYYLYYLIKKGVPTGLSWCVALILGGAVGNVIDSTFYGVLLENAPPDSSTPWFHGQVIDMFYIDIWEGRVADWVPVFGGDYISLWPIFNIADASIFVGVSIILIFQKKFFAEDDIKEAELTTAIENDGNSFTTEDIVNNN